MSANRLLVTGANGFIGKWVLDNWRREHPEDYLIAFIGPGQKTTGNADEEHKIDLLNAEAINALIAKCRPTHVIHLAGQIARAMFRDYIDINVIGTQNLFEALAELNKYNPVRVVQASSAAVYGEVKTNNLPICESQNKKPVTPYGFSKLLQQQVGEFMWRTNRLPVITACIFNTIGPGQAPYLVPMTFVRQLIDIKKGSQKKLKAGNLAAKRDFLDIRDIVRALESLLTDGVPGNVYNVGSGECFTIDEIARILMRLSDCEVIIESSQNLMNQQDVSIVRADISKIKNDTNWQPRISISEALKFTWQASLQAA